MNNMLKNILIGGGILLICLIIVLMIFNKKENFFFEVIVNEKILKFINLLYKLNVIRRFVRVTPKKYRIYTA